MQSLKNHVEARSYRIDARQYVSETHDHKPDSPTNHKRKSHDRNFKTRRDRASTDERT